MKNWKTTLAGILGAVATVVLPMVAGGPITWSAVGTAAALAAIGYLAKDKDVTGVEVK